MGLLPLDPSSKSECSYRRVSGLVQQGPGEVKVGPITKEWVDGSTRSLGPSYRRLGALVGEEANWTQHVTTKD